MAMDKDALIRENIQTIGLDSFPDDENVTWNIIKIEHKGKYSYVEAKPDPDMVGYPQFKFVIAYKGESLEAVACYCLEGGKWGLLFDTPGYPDI